MAGARYLSRAATDAEVRFYIYDNSLVDMQIRRHMSVFPFPSEIQRVTRNADLAIVSASPTSASARAYVEKHRKGRPIILCPMTPFGGYFPDFEYYAGPVINQRSALSSRIVLECYLRNYSPEKALSFFNENTFARLGYFQAWDAGINVLSDHFKDAGLDLASFLPGWLRKGVFMQDHLHPQNFVIEDLFAHLASSHGVELKAPSTQEDLLPLTFLDIMPVYPEIAERLNIPQYGSYSFKVLSTDRQTTYSIELDEFIHWSYHNYRNDAQLTQRLQSLPHTKRPFPRLEEL